MITTTRWKYGCPFGHTHIMKRRQGNHAGMYFCKTCNKFYPEKVERAKLNFAKVIRNGKPHK